MGTVCGAEGDALPDLFTPALEIETGWTAEPLSALVLRQRLVKVHCDLIGAEKGPASILRLNLFEDAVVRAVCDVAAADRSGGYVWAGYVEGSPADRIVMAVSSNRVGAFVHAGGNYYQIRPAQKDLHVVREIDRQRLAGASTSIRGASVFESDVATLVNQERVIEGLPVLKVDDQLTAAAQGHSTDMAANDYVSHDSLDGRAFTDRIAETGYPYDACGENVAGGGAYATPELVMAGWMASPLHRENILRENFCDIGVGYAHNPSSSLEHFWTQNFGRRSSVDACPHVIDDGAGLSSGTGGSGGGGCFADALSFGPPAKGSR